MSAKAALTGICGPWLGWVSLSALANPPDPAADALLPADFRTVAAGLGAVGSTFIGARIDSIAGEPG
jgi:hypothetical protein